MTTQNNHHNQYVKPLLNQGLTLMEATKRASLEKAMDGFQFVGVINNLINSNNIIFCHSFHFKGNYFVANKLSWIFNNKIATGIHIINDEIKGIPFHKQDGWIFTILNDNGKTISIKAYYLDKDKVKHSINIVVVH